MRYFLILVLLVLFVSTMGCGGVANESATGNNSSQDSQTTNSSSTCSTTQPSLVEVTSDIDSNTTWKTDTVYLIKTYDFYVNATLTIEPGTIIKFHPTLGPVMMLGSGGVIKAQGTEDEPIIFTSYYDDNNGCDTNGDGSSTEPDVLDWGAIDLNGENGSQFDYCEFYYGGDTSYGSTLALSSGSVATVINSIFAHNDGGNGLTGYGALDASLAGKGTIIQNNVFYDNETPITISTYFDFDASNSFANPNDSTETNTYNGIFVETIDHITGHITWSEDEVAYVIDDNDFWIETGASLTLEENVTLKFSTDSVMVLADGTSQLVLSSGSNEEDSVLFTSYKDDNSKGDTNADGTNSSPSSTDWLGIYDDTAIAPYYINWSNIDYAANP